MAPLRHALPFEAGLACRAWLPPANGAARRAVALEAPRAVDQVLVHGQRRSVVELERVVEARDRPLAPPLVVDPPAAGLPDAPARPRPVGALHHGRPAGAVGLDRDRLRRVDRAENDLRAGRAVDQGAGYPPLLHVTSAQRRSGIRDQGSSSTAW